MGEKKVYVSSENWWSTTYFFAVVGTAIYYVQNAVGFWDGVLGIIKAMFWPAVVMYRAMEFLHPAVQ